MPIITSIIWPTEKIQYLQFEIKISFILQEVKVLFTFKINSHFEINSIIQIKFNTILLLLRF